MRKLFLVIPFLVTFVSCSSAPKPIVPPEMADGIKSAIKNNQNKFARCHNDAVKKKTGFTEGTVHLQWEIDEKGSAKNAGVKPANDKQSDLKFEKCLVSAVQKIKFPAATKDQFARVVYPFIFKK